MGADMKGLDVAPPPERGPTINGESIAEIAERLREGGGLRIGTDPAEITDHVADAMQYAATGVISNVTEPKVEITDDGVFVNEDGVRQKVMTMPVDSEGRIDLGGLDLRGCSFNTETRIDARTWKALALIGCVEGYEEEKQKSAERAVTRESYGPKED